MYNDLNSCTVLHGSEVNKKIKNKKERERASTWIQIHTLNDVVYDITFNKWQKLKIQTQSCSRQTTEQTVHTKHT
jgi:hypothetical protein